MTLTRLIALGTQIKGRVKRYTRKNVKKLVTLQRATTFAIAIPLVMPVGLAGAAQVGSQSTLIAAPTQVATELVLSNDENILAVPDNKITIELTESEYQKKLRERRNAALARAAKVQAQTAVKTSRTPDPGAEEKRNWVKKAASAYGIDWKLLEAVWQIESGKQWYTAVRSYAGAQGPCQFMPGTWRAYAQDGNGDGQKDVYDARDCLFGSAQLLARNGAAAGNIDRALFAYNHSFSYVAKVIRIMHSIAD